VLDALEEEVRSARDRPTHAELEGARRQAEISGETYNAARDAMWAHRPASICETEAANHLRLLRGELPPEVIAQLLGELLPPDEREGAKLVERIVNLAISLNQMVSYNRYVTRDWN